MGVERPQPQIKWKALVQ